MVTELINFLTKVDEKWSNKNGVNHYITLGYKEQLKLCVFSNDKVYSFSIDEDDIKNPEASIAFIQKTIDSKL